jgi:hypothetical protein
MKIEGSFAKLLLAARSEPLVRTIRRPRAARDVAFCGGRAWTPDSYCRDFEHMSFGVFNVMEYA